MAAPPAARSGFDLAAALKEAGLAAFVAAVLAVPLAGLETVTEFGGLAIHTRWDWVAIAVAAVFVGRLLLVVVCAARRGRVRKEGGGGIAKVIQQQARFFGPIAVAVAVALPFLPFADRHILDVSILVLTYVMLGWGLNIVVGLAGLLDLGYVAFYAVGAYSYALFALNFDLGFWVCLPIAGLLAAMFGILLGFPVLRLRGDYLAIVTLGFGEMIRVILINWYSLTKGPDGLSGVPRPSFFGLPFSSGDDAGETFHSFFGLEYESLHRIIFLYYLILILALITNAFTLRIRKLPIGRAWEALREDEIACRSLGINPRNTKLTAFSLGAMFGGFAGSFFATRQGFISPESFTFIESATILAIVVLGGMGSQIGVVIATLVLIGGPELMRELQEFRMLAFGGLMVLIMIWRPRGLLAFREPTLRLFSPRRTGPPVAGRAPGAAQ
jgi:branched-chain amino acid transport system permease protein